MKKGEIRNKVYECLVRYPVTRDNDNILICLVMDEMFGTTDMREIASSYDVNYYESIRRARQIIQSINPLLASTNKVEKARRKKEVRVRKEMRGI